MLDVPKLYAPVFALFTLCEACAPFSNRTVHSDAYVARAVPAAPDYSSPSAWAALPDRKDEADGVASGSQLPDRQATAGADVFFLYPTIYTDEPGDRFPWNASTTDQALNTRIDESTIRMQASIFNAAGRVFAPRYRQAHISAYYTSNKPAAAAAFDTAYADVQAAFELFLRKHNEGRPIIIAGHSQGTTHAKRLVRDYFDGKPLADRLVAAYLVGIPVAPDYFQNLEVCQQPDQTKCFVTWRTWQRPAAPWDVNGDGVNEQTPPSTPPVVVNPLSWTTATTRVSPSENTGGTLRKLSLIDELVGAQIHEGILWIERPDFFGKRIIRMDNWHVADYNLFYESVRRNAVARAEAFANQ